MLAATNFNPLPENVFYNFYQNEKKQTKWTRTYEI